MRLVLALTLVALFRVPAAAAERGPAPSERRPPAGRCLDGDPLPSRILRVEPDGEILLASGQRVALVDLRPADRVGAESAAAARSAAWLGSLGGREVSTRLAGAADRWGRIQGTVSLVPDGIDLGELLVAEGLARVDIGERDGLCRPELLTAEAVARSRRLGLWAEVREPVEAGDLARLRELAGRFVVVEGRIARVGERGARTYLDFGRDIARDFAVTVPRRAWLAMKRAGLDAAALSGRTVRVRGVVEMRRGPVMEVLSPDMIERPGTAEGR